MTSLFLSYGSADRQRAVELAGRLRGEGYSAVFLDVDPESGITPGSRWERELYAALRRSQAVVFLVSDTSVTSCWCFAELALARSRGLPVVSARVGGRERSSLVTEFQEVDLQAPAGFDHLLAALRAARVGPDDDFAWNPARSPYPGLVPFGVEDAAVFFGRDAEIERLLELLSVTVTRGAGRFVCLVGPSGSGKSSLLRAGLLPRMARQPQRWLLVPPITPGQQPTRRFAAALSAVPARGRGTTVDELEAELTAGGATALRRRLDEVIDAGSGAPNVLVVLDQLEELATRTGPREQQSFLRLLDEALVENSPLWVVATMRSEFLSADPDRAGLSDIINDPLIVGPLSRTRLPEVIVRPARRAGLEFEPGLVERIVADTPRGDALPLLAYTLHELAGRALNRDGATVTATDYDAIGGVVGALRSRADQLVGELVRRDHDPQKIERTLLRLAAVDDDGLPVRRRVRRAALDRDEQAVVNAFVDARLLVANRLEEGASGNGAATVEVAHEALLRQWEPLRRVIDSERTALRLRAELGREAADWEAGGREPSYLLHGGRLGVVDSWATEHPGDLDALERQFLEASRNAAEERLQAVRRTNGRLRRLSIGLAVALVVALVATAVAVQKQNEASLQANLALTRQLLAQAAELRPTQPDLSLLLGVEAVDRASGAGAEPARYALADGLNRAFHVATPLIGHSGAVDAVVVAPHGRIAASLGEDGTARLWSVPEGLPLAELPGARRTPAGNPLAFDRDGRILAVASGPTVQLWDVVTRQPHGGPLAGHSGTVFKVAFSRDGTLLATASADRTVRLWDVAGAAPIGSPLTGHEDGVFDVVLSPDGRTVAAGGYDGTARTWDVATGVPGPVLAGHTEAVAVVAFSSDSSTLYSASEDGTMGSWDVRSGTRLHTLTADDDAVTAMALSPDDTTLVSGGADGTVRLWDASTGAARGVPLTGHDDAIRDLAFGRDSATVASGSIDGSLRLWDTATGKVVGDPLTGHTSRVLDIAMSPDGRTAVSASADGTARLWETSETRPLERVVFGGIGFLSVAVAPENQIVAGGTDGRVRLSDRAGSGPTVELTGHTGPVNAVAVANGVIASGGADGTVRVWDVEARRPVGLPLSTDNPVLDVALNEDGSRVAAAGKDGTVTVWDVGGVTPRSRIPGRPGVVAMSVAFGAGATIAAGSFDGTIQLWDTDTGRPTRTPLTADGAVQDVAFSPDGSVVAAAGAASTIQFWNVATGKPHGRRITGFTAWVNDIAFTPDGRTLAAAGDEGLQLWDVETGRARGARLQERTISSAVGFGADGSTIASAGENATIVWDLHTPSMLVQACRIANRSMSRDEWEQFLGEAVPGSGSCRS